MGLLVEDRLRRHEDFLAMAPLDRHGPRGGCGASGWAGTDRAPRCGAAERAVGRLLGAALAPGPGVRLVAAAGCGCARVLADPAAGRDLGDRLAGAGRVRCGDGRVPGSRGDPAARRSPRGGCGGGAARCRRPRPLDPGPRGRRHRVADRSDLVGELRRGDEAPGLVAGCRRQLERRLRRHQQRQDGSAEHHLHAGERHNEERRRG